MTGTTRLDFINEMMLAEFTENNIPVTDEHRLIFLEGLKETWEEDDNSSLSNEEAIEKCYYMLALNGEIFRLKMAALMQ